DGDAEHRPKIAEASGLRYAPRRSEPPGRTPAPSNSAGGKSGLHRAGCWLTASRGDSRDSATENKPPAARPVRVKRCGKSAPRSWRQGRQGKPHPEQGHIGEQCGGPPRSRVARSRPPATAVLEECPPPPRR